MPTPEKYQERAADLLRIAQETEDLVSKALLLQMAQSWINLAERARADQDSTSWNLPDPDDDGEKR